MAITDSSTSSETSLLAPPSKTSSTTSQGDSTTTSESSDPGSGSDLTTSSNTSSSSASSSTDDPLSSSADPPPTTSSHSPTSSSTSSSSSISHPTTTSVSPSPPTRPLPPSLSPTKTPQPQPPPVLPTSTVTNDKPHVNSGDVYPNLPSEVTSAVVIAPSSMTVVTITETSISGNALNYNLGVSRPVSTWTTVIGATLTTQTITATATINGRTVTTTFPVTTSVGGYTTTVTGFGPSSISSSTVTHSGSSTGSPPRANNTGIIVSSVIGVAVAFVALLLLCLRYRRRRTDTNVESRLTECPVPVSSRRARRSRYKDMASPTDTSPGNLQTTQLWPGQLVNAGSSSSYISPPSATSYQSPFNSSRRKASPKLIDISAISSPVGPVTVEGDSTALRSAMELTAVTPVAPLLDLVDSDERMFGPRHGPSLSIVTEMEEERESQVSRGSVSTDASITFNRPVSDSSSTVYHDYKSWTGYYDPNPFSDPIAPSTSSHTDTLIGQKRISGGSTAFDHSTGSHDPQPPRFKFDNLPADGALRGPNFMALMNEAKRNW